MNHQSKCLNPFLFGIRNALLVQCICWLGGLYLLDNGLVQAQTEPSNGGGTVTTVAPLRSVPRLSKPLKISPQFSSSPTVSAPPRRISLSQSLRRQVANSNPTSREPRFSRRQRQAVVAPRQRSRIASASRRQRQAVVAPRQRSRIASASRRQRPQVAIQPRRQYLSNRPVRRAQVITVQPRRQRLNTRPSPGVRQQIAIQTRRQRLNTRPALRVQQPVAVQPRRQNWNNPSVVRVSTVAVQPRRDRSQPRLSNNTAPRQQPTIARQRPLSSPRVTVSTRQVSVPDVHFIARDRESHQHRNLEAVATVVNQSRRLSPPTTPPRVNFVARSHRPEVVNRVSTSLVSTTTRTERRSHRQAARRSHQVALVSPTSTLTPKGNRSRRLPTPQHLATGRGIPPQFAIAPAKLTPTHREVMASAPPQQTTSVGKGSVSFNQTGDNWLAPPQPNLSQNPSQKVIPVPIDPVVMNPFLAPNSLEKQGPLSLFPTLTNSQNISTNNSSGSTTYPNNGNTGLLFPLPSPAPTTSPFGWRIHPLFGTRRLHSGTDLSAPLGTPVIASFRGTVALAEYVGGYGLMVALRHLDGKQESRYAHLQQAYVQKGDGVEQGQIIGLVGSTGNSTGPHLHFEWRHLMPRGWVAVDAGPNLEVAMAQLKDGIPGIQTPGAPPLIAQGDLESTKPESIPNPPIVVLNEPIDTSRLPIPQKPIEGTSKLPVARVVEPSTNASPSSEQIVNRNSELETTPKPAETTNSNSELETTPKPAETTDSNSELETTPKPAETTDSNDGANNTPNISKPLELPKPSILPERGLESTNSPVSLPLGSLSKPPRAEGEQGNIIPKPSAFYREETNNSPEIPNTEKPRESAADNTSPTPIIEKPRESVSNQGNEGNNDPLEKPSEPISEQENEGDNPTPETLSEPISEQGNEGDNPTPETLSEPIANQSVPPNGELEKIGSLSTLKQFEGVANLGMLEGWIDRLRSNNWDSIAPLPTPSATPQEELETTEAPPIEETKEPLVIPVVPEGELETNSTLSVPPTTVSIPNPLLGANGELETSRPPAPPETLSIPDLSVSGELETTSTPELSEPEAIKEEEKTRE